MGLTNNAHKSRLFLHSERRRSGECTNYMPQLMCNFIAYVKTMEILSGQKCRSKGRASAHSSAHVQGHLATDHVELTRAHIYGCQEKAVSVSHKPLVLFFKPILIFSLFPPPGYNARPTENKYNSIAKGIPRT